MMLNIRLRELNLDGNKLGTVWCQQFAGLFARNNTLQQVSLCNNHLDCETGRLLVNAYRYSTSLIELGLSKDEVGGGALWEEFLQTRNLKHSFVSRYDRVTERNANEATVGLGQAYSSSHGGDSLMNEQFDGDMTISELQYNFNSVYSRVNPGD